jgi:hypothetical protein
MAVGNNLVASHPQNLNALKHGLYSPRTFAPRAREVADGLMELPHVQPLDRLAADEIGSIIARLEAIDRDLHEREQLSRGQRSRAGAHSCLSIGCG